MKTINLYRYTRGDGSITTSPVQPSDRTAYELRYRLIAGDGKALTDGVTITSCIDVSSPDGWTEIDDPGEMTETKQKALAYDILTGVNE